MLFRSIIKESFGDVVNRKQVIDRKMTPTLLYLIERPNGSITALGDLQSVTWVSDFLEENEFEVVSATDGIRASEVLYEESFDLLLLDVNVPNMNGFELLKEFRKAKQTPAIFITSLNSIDDLECGYECGCEDYIKKPFILKELLLRINALLKKSSSVKICENIDFDPLSNSLHVDGQNVDLNAKECHLLKLFVQNSDKLLTHEFLLENLWSYDEVASEGSLRTYIKNLRKYIGKEKIVSFKKLGYKFTTQ